MIKLVCALLIAAFILIAGETSMGFVPATDTAVTTRDARLRAIWFNNPGMAATTCRVKDRGNNCSSGNCTVWGPAEIGASGDPASVVTWPAPGLPMEGGIQWSCDDANTVVGQLQWQ